MLEQPEQQDENNEPDHCSLCNGVGENRYEQKCRNCGGSGVEPSEVDDFDWFPAGPQGDYGLTWEQAGLTPPATLKEYEETYHPKTCKCSNGDVCEECY